MSLPELRSTAESQEKLLGGLQDKLAEITELLVGAVPAVESPANNHAQAPGALGELAAVQAHCTRRILTLYSQVDQLRQVLGLPKEPVPDPEKSLVAGANVGKGPRQAVTYQGPSDADR